MLTYIDGHRVNHIFQTMHTHLSVASSLQCGNGSDRYGAAGVAAAVTHKEACQVEIAAKKVNSMLSGLVNLDTVLENCCGFPLSPWHKDHHNFEAMHKCTVSWRCAVYVMMLYYYVRFRSA